MCNNECDFYNKNDLKCWLLRNWKEILDSILLEKKYENIENIVLYFAKQTSEIQNNINSYWKTCNNKHFLNLKEAEDIFYRSI